MSAKYFCNGCGAETGNIGVVKFDFSPQITAQDNGGPRGSERSMSYKFAPDPISVGTHSFNTTDIHFCRACQAQAIKDAIAKIS